jgi:hypothetical protein
MRWDDRRVFNASVVAVVVTKRDAAWREKPA